MKLMISQPMRNKSNEQIRKERASLILELEKEGYEIIDTIFSDETPKNCNEALYYLSKSIEAMSKVDGVVFMNGWEDARGCRIEYEVALSYNKFIKIL